MHITLSSYIPLFSAAFVLSLGIFTFSRYLRTKRELELVLSLFCGSVTVWLFGTFMMFISTTDAQAIFWDRFVYSGVVFVPTLMHHFSVVFADLKGQRKYLKIGYALSLIFLILSWTNLFVSDLYRYEWGNHTKAQLFHHIFIVLFFAYTSVFFVNIWKFYKSGIDEKLKNQARYVFAAFFTLIVLGAPAYLPAYGISVPPFPFISGLLFIVILSYAILRHKLLDVKAAGAIFLTFILIIILVANLFSSSLLFKILALAIMLIVGYFLLNTIQKEAEHAERNEKLADKLEKDKKELVELDRMKDEFLQMATHELNTPITAIQGRLDMAVRENMCKLNDEQKAYFQPILNEVMRLAHLSKDVLNVARIDQHRLTINPTETDIDALISQIVTSLDIKAKERGNSLAYIKMNKMLPKLTLDQSKIGEVITNLINNANKFTENGKIAVTSKLKDDVVVISVADTGIGMDKEDQKHLFEKFYQAGRFDSNNPQEQQGSGLGLYISQNIIKLHGGEMWLASEKGKGSTFYFSLPQEYKEIKQSTRIHSDGTNLRVL